MIVSPLYACDYRHLDTIGDCVVSTVWFLSSWSEVYLYLGNSNEQNMYNKDKKSNQWSSVYYKTEV